MKTMSQTMNAYWQDLEGVVHSTHPRTLTLTEALNQWADGRGAEGNFFGLIDSEDNTIQFYFEDSIPDDVDDAGHLRIVTVDFPKPALRGSFQKLVTIYESSELIKRAYEHGAQHENFENLSFCKWQS